MATTTSLPVFYIEDDVKRIEEKGTRGKLLAAHFEERVFKAIAVDREQLGRPRRGVRMRP